MAVVVVRTHRDHSEPGAEPAAVRRYLAEFLSDRRVIEIPPIAWQPILRGIILNTRPKKSAASPTFTKAKAAASSTPMPT